MDLLVVRERERVEGRKRPRQLSKKWGRQELKTPGLIIAPLLLPKGLHCAPGTRDGGGSWQFWPSSVMMPSLVAPMSIGRTSSVLTFGVADTLPGRPDQRAGTRKL